jgi:hypothetical protein
VLKQVTTSVESTYEIRQQLEKAEKIIAKQKLAIARRSRIIRQQHEAINLSRKSVKKLFNGDQLLALERKSNRGSKWSIDTIQKGLRTKFVCGARGYSELLEQGMPLPSLRTLRRSLETSY